jgi:hypothetical protein
MKVRLLPHELTKAVLPRRARSGPLIGFEPSQYRPDKKIALGLDAICRQAGIGNSKGEPSDRTRRLERSAGQRSLKILGQHRVIPLLAPDLDDMARRHLPVQALRREVVD